MSESVDLKPVDALSQVVFIHDYLQLVFQFQRFSIFNVSEIVRGGQVLRSGAPGFSDALISLIDHRVVAAGTTGRFKLSLTFDDGTEFHVLSGCDAERGPEAFEFWLEGGSSVVRQND